MERIRVSGSYSFRTGVGALWWCAVEALTLM